MASFVAPRCRGEAKVNSSTELAEVLGPTGSFGRDALRRVLARITGRDPMEAIDTMTTE
ncbi:MAG: hypothetical protein JO251_14860 [Verrucomicrobia bacterium]|nr:hypothetical protein [Verrucomicrobiota bacterium]